MQSFTYVARMNDGSLSRGNIEARNITEARASLLQTFTDILDLQQLPADTVPEGPVYRYYPLVETLRLYCGWLCALLFVLYAVGAPYVLHWNTSLYLVRDWVTAPLFRDVSLAAFLFLFATSLHRRVHGGMLTGLLLLVVSLAALGAFLAAPGLGNPY